MEASNPYAPPSAPVRDIAVEGVSFEAAGRGARLGAYALDLLIGLILIYLPVFFFSDLLKVVGGNATPEEILAELARAVFAMLPGSLIHLSLTLWLVIRNRQTIGKKLVGIKVTRKNGERVGMGRLFWMRNVILGVLYAIPIFNYLVFLVDHLLIFRQSRQCLHDQIADTIVVRA